MSDLKPLSNNTVSTGPKFRSSDNVSWTEHCRNHFVGTSPNTGHSAEFAFEPWATVQGHLTIVQNLINSSKSLLHPLKEYWEEKLYMVKLHSTGPVLSMLETSPCSEKSWFFAVDQCTEWDTKLNSSAISESNLKRFSSMEQGSGGVFWWNKQRVNISLCGPFKFTLHWDIWYREHFISTRLASGDHRLLFFEINFKGTRNFTNKLGLSYLKTYFPFNTLKLCSWLLVSLYPDVPMLVSFWSRITPKGRKLIKEWLQR